MTSYISTQKYCYLYYSFAILGILMTSCNRKYFFNTHTFASGKHLWNDEDTTNWLHGIYICSESTAFEVRMITSKETILRFCVGPITDTYAYYTTSVYRRDIFLSLSSISNYAWNLERWINGQSMIGIPFKSNGTFASHYISSDQGSHLFAFG